MAADGGVYNATSDNILPGSSHEQIETPYIVYDVAYRRELDLAIDSGWTAEITTIVWHGSRDEALALGKLTREALEGINLDLNGVAVRHIRCLSSEPFDLSPDPGVKFFGVLSRLEAYLDA